VTAALVGPGAVRSLADATNAYILAVRRTGDGCLSRCK